MAQFALHHQIDLLQSCITNSLVLHDELAKLGAWYENLIYRYNSKGFFDYNETYQTLENYDFPSTDIPFVSFFTGSGGLDLGFEAAGFSHLASLELVELFSDTLKMNRPNWNIFSPPHYTGDVRHHEEVITFLEKSGVTKNFEGVFFGGPPCQPFSIASNQRFSKEGDLQFKRVGFANEDYGNLLFDYVYYIIHFRPRVFMIENVPGLKTIDDGKQLTNAIEILTKAGYDVAPPTIMDASHYGIPQQRQRLIVIGSRSKQLFEFPPIETTRFSSWSALKKPISGLFNHITRHHEASSVLRYMELQYGQRDKLGRVDRLHPDKPSKTVIAGGSKGGGRSHLHPFIPRTLSVRECARLQTFPDDFIFCGAPARQFTQVGNAVPPILALKLARQIYQSYYQIN